MGLARCAATRDRFGRIMPCVFHIWHEHLLDKQVRQVAKDAPGRYVLRFSSLPMVC